MLQRRPPTDRERERRRAATRRRRQREREGKAMCLLEYDGRVLNLLERHGYLVERDMHDRGKVRAAIERLLYKAVDAENL
jgi:hypothetical protein